MAKKKTPACRLTEPVFFVGFMGSGKSSVTRKLARICGICALDMDSYIERLYGRAIKEIFAEEGESGFRKKETDLLGELLEGEPRLVSCGGGVVVTDENREMLKEHGYVVYLHVTADEAASRIRDTSTRPLFQDLDSARRRAAEREPLYSSVADLTIDTAGKSVNSIAYEVKTALEREGILCPQPE